MAPLLTHSIKEKKMKNLFIIDGASGTGKSDLIHYIHENSAVAACVPKLTTREQRKYEKSQKRVLDLEFVSDEQFEKINPSYRYTYTGCKYGFTKKSLDEALSSNDNVFVIVRNKDVIEKLRVDYPYINLIRVYIYTDQNMLEQRLLQQEGDDKETVKFRMNQIGTAFADFMRHPQIYDEILINCSNQNDYRRLIELLIEKHSHAINVDPSLISVFMSFNENNHRLLDIYNTIHRAVTKLGDPFRCERIDFLRQGGVSISDEARSLMKKSRFVIVDLCEMKNNVFYELGFAHGLGKQFILTAPTGTDTGFYAREFRTLYYKNMVELENSVHEELKSLLRIAN
ncbi:hypothetical protein LJC41_06580 [Desulfosarcina sp. OttesenSCG-928-G17]|nr:hypothetical protein [Desulfosarcina sp. OttesenSCG-928-G17]